AAQGQVLPDGDQRLVDEPDREPVHRTQGVCPEQLRLPQPRSVAGGHRAVYQVAQWGAPHQPPELAAVQTPTPCRRLTGARKSLTGHGTSSPVAVSSWKRCRVVTSSGLPSAS